MNRMTKSLFRSHAPAAMTKSERPMSNETDGCGFTSSFGIRHSTFACVVAEWQHAVTCGKAINPILRIGDFPLVPDELKLLGD